MRTVIVTGSAGLIGSETVKRFAKEGARLVGIDNDMRAQFFGAEAAADLLVQEYGRYFGLKTSAISNTFGCLTFRSSATETAMLGGNMASSAS